MRLDDISESSNVEDRRGQGGSFGGGMPGGRAGLGFGTIAILTIVGYLLGINPAILIGGAEMIGAGREAVTQRTSAPPRSSPQEEQLRTFVARVLKTNEDVWQQVLPQQAGVPFRPAPLVIFRGATRSACGCAQWAILLPGRYAHLSRHELLRGNAHQDAGGW